MIAETLALVLDADVLARIGGSLGEGARERARELALLDEKAARARRASWLAAARAPIPAGLRGIHASWIEAAIARIGHIERRASDPGRARAGDIERSARAERPEDAGPLARAARRVLLDGPVRDGDVWLARWLCARLPPMPAIDERIVRPRSIAEALAMSATNLRAWLEDVGADTIAFAVGASATAISSRLGPAAVRITSAPRLGEMGERRAAIERARVTLDGTALVRVGARTLGPHAGELERWQLAHRLPRETGIWADLEAFAGAVGGPTWRALAAP